MFNRSAIPIVIFFVAASGVKSQASERNELLQTLTSTIDVKPLMQKKHTIADAFKFVQKQCRRQGRKLPLHINLMAFLLEDPDAPI